MDIFKGNIKIIAGEIHTWQELILVAIEARTYSADGPTNTKLKRQAKERVPAAHAFIRRFLPSANIFIVDAYKGNTNGTINQAAWTLPGDLTASPGGGDQYDGGVEYKRHRVGLASEAIYAAADATINVEIEAE